MRILCSPVLWGLVGAALAIVLVLGAVRRPAVGIIKIDVAIDSSEITKDIVKMVDYARQSRDIRAVVLEIDTPGGSAVLTEEIYLQVEKLRQVKPVVTSVDSGALSGGYYIGVAAEAIFAKPTSLVGSVGVWMNTPEMEEVTEDLLPSGPYKASGISPQDAASMLQMVKEGFVGVVMKERGARLKMDKDELSQARIYVGMQALKSGLIDRIGSTEEAIAYAAGLARVANYSVVDINELLDIDLSTPSFFFESRPPVPNSKASPVANQAPRFYYLYLDSQQGVK